MYYIRSERARTERGTTVDSSRLLPYFSPVPRDSLRGALIHTQVEEDLSAGFTGGSALVGVTGSTVGAMIETPLDTDVDIGMLLANAYYNIIQTHVRLGKVGQGAGEVLERFLVNQSNSSSITSTDRIYDRSVGGAYLEVGEKRGISGGISTRKQDGGRNKSK